MNDDSEPPLAGGSVASSQQDRTVQRIRLDVAYDGTDLHGFAENPGVDTVGGRLRAAIERVLGQQVELTCAGRTDAGVHARAQVVTFDAPGGVVEPDRLRRALNSLLGPRIAILAVRFVEGSFDARFSAKWRAYRYLVLQCDVPHPFLARTAWWVREPLDLEVMRAGAAALVGEHDFSSFCRRPKVERPVSMVRRVLHADWAEEERGHHGGAAGQVFRFEIVATSFCHQMVRAIVGTLIDAGRGRERCADMPAILAAKDRAAAGQVAPPQGLCLWEVGYGDAVPTMSPPPE